MPGSSPGAWLVDRPTQRLPLLYGIVLAQRMTLKPFVHEYTFQVRMPPKADPEHVPDLALKPVGSGPQRGDGIHLGNCLFHGNHQAQAMLVSHGEEVVYHREARLGRRSGPRVLIRNLGSWAQSNSGGREKSGFGPLPKGGEVHGRQ